MREIVQILNRQKFFRPNAAKLKKLVGFFLDKSAELSKKNFDELSLLLTDDAGIRKIKRQFFDIDCVTDVISFALRPRPAEGNRAAEIVINMAQAGREGKKRKGVDREFALYLAHGCDHLAGHDDRTVKERKNMRRRELQWLKKADKLDLLSGLFRPARERKSGSNVR